MKRLALTIAVLAVLLTPTSAGAYTCTATYSSLAALQTAVASAAGGTTQCLANGTYAGTLTLATSASTAVAVAPATSLGATVTQGVVINSGKITLQNFAVQNSLTGVSGTIGNCVRISPGVTARTAVTVRDSTLTQCQKDGVKFDRPENSGSAYDSGALIYGNTINAVGLAGGAGLGNAITIYAENSTIQNNVVDGSVGAVPNDVIEAWGLGMVISDNRFKNVSNAVGNHNDALQSWTGLNDGKEGQALVNLKFERNLVASLTGANAHGVMVEGPGYQLLNINSNIFQNVGSRAAIFGVTGGSAILSAYFENNTIYGADGTGAVVEYNAASAGRLRNNVFKTCANSAPWVLSGGSVTVTNNLSNGCGTMPVHTGGLTSDPLFVGPVSDTSADTTFQLQDLSPARNSGDTAVSRSLAYGGGSGVLSGIDRGAWERG